MWRIFYRWILLVFKKQKRWNKITVFLLGFVYCVLFSILNARITGGSKILHYLLRVKITCCPACFKNKGTFSAGSLQEEPADAWNRFWDKGCCLIGPGKVWRQNLQTKAKLEQGCPQITSWVACSQTSIFAPNDYKVREMWSSGGVTNMHNGPLQGKLKQMADTVQY